MTRRLSELRTGDTISVEEYRALTSGAMLEEELLVIVQEELTLRGWRWTHARRSDRAQLMGDPGVPDILAIRGTRGLAAELKRQGERPTDQQTAWLGLFGSCAAVCTACRNEAARLRSSLACLAK